VLFRSLVPEVPTMTVAELSNILAALPHDWDECELWITTGGVTHAARCVIVVPGTPDDPLSPRVELRSGLVYRPDETRENEK